MSARPAALALCLLAVACGGGATSSPAASAPAVSPSAAAPTAVLPTAASATDAPATEAPTVAPSAPPQTLAPGASLDPSLSDAGIVGRVTIVDDTRGGRTGTHDIVAVASHGFGSSCSFTMDGDEFIAVAYNDDAPDGAVRHMAVSVPTDSMPVNDGEQRIDINDGVAYVDFASESGVGTAYTGAAERDEGMSSIDVTVAGDTVFFEYEATTWDSVEFSGQLVCAGVEF